MSPHELETRETEENKRDRKVEERREIDSCIIFSAPVFPILLSNAVQYRHEGSRVRGRGSGVVGVGWKGGVMGPCRRREEGRRIHISILLLPRHNNGAEYS